jgi:FeS assembly SUF system regulator
MLRVTRLTDYATVVLTVLARAPDAVHSAAGLAESLGIEAATVAKVLKQLGQAGLVASFRGAAGGYRLAREPQTIRLADIVEAIEGPLGLTECSLHDGDCGIEHQCGVRAGWKRINDVINTALRDTTLADMLAPAVPPSRGKAIPAALQTA